MTPIERNYLLSLSRRAITKYLSEGSILIIDEDALPSENLKEKKGVFVTLTINNELRGCIGNLEPEKPIYQAVIDNSLAAAFYDPRFTPLEFLELEQINIEISILSPLKKLQFSNVNELLNYLKQKKPGIFIKKGLNQATFLPQVWEELTKPEEFLSHLCIKANLPKNCWQNLELEIYEYEVEKFQESDSKLDSKIAG